MGDVLDTCPECGTKLHQGEHQFKDGKYVVKYCKRCGFRREKPL
ncbi:MAG: hypothetical protein AABX72_00050 [Nanoarchaeota archaeon]